MIKRNLFILIIIFLTLIAKAQKWTSFTNLNISISGYQVNSEAVDVNGVYWFGTNNGVSKFDGKIWTNYSTINGLVSDSVNIITIIKMVLFGPEHKTDYRFLMVHGIMVHGILILKWV